MMAGLMRSATLKGPLLYEKADGQTAAVPLGPCLVEQLDGELVTIIWGAIGELSTVLPMKELDQAIANGDLVFLD